MTTRYFYYDRATGMVLHQSETLADIGHPYISSVRPAEDLTLCYVAGGSLVDMPPKPSEHHVFDYDAKQWIDTRTPETQWPLVRLERNRLLQESDWTQLPDVALASKAAWASYRQALRDVTSQPDPFNIVWPSQPASTTEGQASSVSTQP